VEASVVLQANETIHLAAHGIAWNGAFSLSIGEVLCGDGHRRGGSEECDDGNLINGDGCSDTCRLEAANEVEPNDARAAATPFTGLGRGAISASTDVDMWSFQATAGTTYAISTATRSNLGCGRLPTDDTRLTISDGAGATLRESDDINGANRCSSVYFVPPATGTYFAEVTAPNALPGYFLLVVPL
jgi:cysteine-rich repeat protein